MKNQLLATTLLAINLLAQPLVSYAGFDEGLAAYQKGDYQTALKEWKPLADQGVADAQFNLGLMYENGRGVAQDDKQAQKWFVEAVSQGNARAMAGMALVANTKTEQYAWYNLSSAYGFAEARKMRDDLAKEMTAQELAEGQESTRAWQKILTTLGVK